MYTVAVVDDDLRQCRILADMIADAPFSSFDILTFQMDDRIQAFSAHIFHQQIIQSPLGVIFMVIEEYG